jgi:hypothetical protein
VEKTAIAIAFTFVFLVPSIVNVKITSSYSNNSNINPVAFTLTIYSPDNNQTCNNTLLLNFTIYWTTYPTFAGLPSPPAPVMHGDYSYKIDNNPAVFVDSNQSSSDYYDPRGFKVNPTFSYLVNVSDLANDYHKTVITASLSGLSGGGSIHFSAVSSPVQFLVQNPVPSPSPTPEPFPTTLIIASVSTVAVVCIVLLVYFKKFHRDKNS